MRIAKADWPETKHDKWRELRDAVKALQVGECIAVETDSPQKARLAVTEPGHPGTPKVKTRTVNGVLYVKRVE